MKKYKIIRKCRVTSHEQTARIGTDKDVLSALAKYYNSLKNGSRYTVRLDK